MFQQEKVTDGHTKIDTGRGKRTGVPEAIYTSGKRPLHVREIMESMANRRRNNSDENNNNNNNNIEPVIATRCSEEVFQFCSETIDNLHYYENARIMTLKEDHERAQKQKETDNNNDTIRGKVCIVCAGTSDVNVAEEIAITLELQSTPRIQVQRYYDIGAKERLVPSKFKNCTDFSKNISLTPRPYYTAKSDRNSGFACAC